jgi:exonuclease VII large subunit
MPVSLSQNIYYSLDTPSVPQTECPTRKAKKKLREIEKLKNKSKLTTEEYVKIQEEDIWKAIAFPVDITIQTPEEIEERKLKQREKTIKKLEKQLADEKEKYNKDIQKHKKEMQFIKMNFQEQYSTLRDKYNSLEHINAQLKHDLKTLIENQDRFSHAQPKHAANAPPESFEEKLEEEFLEISRENKSHKKAYITMMLAYHPDKLGDKDIANKASKCINELKEKYPF